MVIWVIGRNYPLPENQMQGSFELEQAKMLVRYGNEVHYLACSLHPTKRIKGTGLQTWDDEGVKVTVLSALFAPRVYPIYFVKGRNKKWKKLFDEVEAKSGLPDVIHVHYPAMLMIADVLKTFHDKGIRIVATEHWTKVLGKKLDSVELKEYRKYSSVLDKMICVGSPLTKSVKELIGIDGEVVPNIVNDLFKPTDKRHDGFRFVAVGRLVKLKQFDKIIEAFCDCFLGQQDVTLTIIGGGEEKKNLQKLVSEKKAAAQIRLVGSQTREKTAEIVSNSDNLICYSTFETFGVPIIEAWACGLTTTTTTTAAAVIDNFDERLGVEVSFDDYEGLKKALKHIYNNRNRYDKTFISEYAKEHFSERVIADRLYKIYAG